MLDILKFTQQVGTYYSNKKTGTIFFFIYSTLNYSIFFFLLNLIVCYKKKQSKKKNTKRFGHLQYVHGRINGG